MWKVPEGACLACGRDGHAGARSRATDVTQASDAVMPGYAFARSGSPQLHASAGHDGQTRGRGLILQSSHALSGQMRVEPCSFFPFGGRRAMRLI